METLSPGVRKCQELGGRSRVSQYFVLVFSPSLPLGKGEGGDKKGRKNSRLALSVDWWELKGKKCRLGPGSSQSPQGPSSCL